MQDDADGHPYDDVHGNEQKNLPYHGRRKSTERLRQWQVDVRPGQGEAGHDGPGIAGGRPGVAPTLKEFGLGKGRSIKYGMKQDELRTEIGLWV